MFVQVAPPNIVGPIKIEGVRGGKIGERLIEISVDNPYPAYLIGLLESQVPHEHARAVASQFVQVHMHDGWFHPVPELLDLIQRVGQTALVQLLAITRPGGIEDERVVDIEGIASILNVSIKTVRRLVDADAIPHLRVGKQLRFVVSDVLASVNRS